MKFNSVWKVKVPKYLSFLIILLITAGLAFAIVAKAQKRAALIVEENRFFYWKVYENELVFFRYPSNYLIKEKGSQAVILKDELRRGEPELSVWFDGRKLEEDLGKKILISDFGNFVFNLAYDEGGADYESEFNLILETVKIK